MPVVYGVNINNAGPALGSLMLSALPPYGPRSAGQLCATISGQSAGTVLTLLVGETGQFVISPDQTQLLAGPSYSPTVSIIRIREAGRGYFNSPFLSAFDSNGLQGLTVSRIATAVTGSLPVWRGAVSGVKARTRRATVLVIGDSTTLGEAGSDSSANSYDGDAIKNSWPAAMAAALTNGGLPASFECFFGDGGCGNYGDFGYPTFNASFGYGSGVTTFTRAQGNQTAGGSPLNIASSSNTGGYWYYNSRGAVTRLKAFILNNQSAYGTFGAQVDGGSVLPFTLSAVSPDAVYTYTYASQARGTHGFAMNYSSGGTLYLLGGYAYDETTPAVDVLACGNRGSQAADWISANGSNPVVPWSPLGMINTIKADLVLVMPPINDLLGGTSLASFTSSLTTLVQAAKAAGSDCHLINAAAIRIGGPNARPAQSVRDTYTAALRQVANTQGLPVPTDLEIPTAPWDAVRWRDDLHPYKGVYAQMGQKVASDLLSLVY